MIENQNGSIKAQDLDTIMAVGIFAKNVQIVDSVGVGFREPAEIPRIKERLMFNNIEWNVQIVRRCWADGDV